MEIHVRRMLYPLRNGGAPWHPGLSASDGIQIVQPPAMRLARTELLADQNALAVVVTAALKPIGRPRQIDLLVATHDADSLEPTVRVLKRVNEAFGTDVPLLAPAPHLQSWLTSKRAIERVYDRTHCTVPEPDLEKLGVDAKTELKRLLATFGGKFDAANQARLAEVIDLEDLAEDKRPCGWSAARKALSDRYEAFRAASSTARS